MEAHHHLFCGFVKSVGLHLEKKQLPSHLLMLEDRIVQIDFGRLGFGVCLKKIAFDNLGFIHTGSYLMRGGGGKACMERGVVSLFSLRKDAGGEEGLFGRDK
jgi:hypothetical protein